MRGVSHLEVGVFCTLHWSLSCFVAALLDEKSWILGLQLRGAVQSAQVQMAQAPSQGKHWPVSTCTVDKFNTEIGRLSRNSTFWGHRPWFAAVRNLRYISHVIFFSPETKVLRWFDRTNRCLLMTRMYVVVLNFPQTLSDVPTPACPHSPLRSSLALRLTHFSQLISRSL